MWSHFCNWLGLVLLKWVTTVGGPAIAFLQVCYAIKYRESPPMTSWYVLGSCFLLAVFLTWRDERIKVENTEARRPHIVCIASNSTAEDEVTQDHRGDIIVRVKVTLNLVNNGDGDVHNYKIAVYSCWFKEPSKIDKSSDDFFAQWSPGEQVTYPFSHSKLAENIGDGRVGITSLDEIVFVVEISGKANTSEGPDYNEEMWLCWALDHPIRPPNPAMASSVRPHIDRLKELILAESPMPPSSI